MPKLDSRPRENSLCMVSSLAINRMCSSPRSYIRESILYKNVSRFPFFGPPTLTGLTNLGAYNCALADRRAGVPNVCLMQAVLYKNLGESRLSYSSRGLRPLLHGFGCIVPARKAVSSSIIPVHFRQNSIFSLAHVRTRHAGQCERCP